MEKILVLLSSYNGEKYIEEQVLSIINQKGIEVYILIRDDGSKDNTVKIISQLAEKNERIRLLKAQNVGCARSFIELVLNAAAYTDFEYFAFADQDDYWLEEKLERAVSILKEKDNNKQLLYCSNLWVVDKNLCNKKMKYPENYVNIVKSSSLAESYGTGCTMVFNRKVIEFYKEHQPEWIHLHDLWFYHQVLFLGEVFYDENSFIYYRQHENNVVGAHKGISTQIKAKIKSIKNLKTQHYREIEAKEILNTYGVYLENDDYKYVKIVAEYKENFTARMRLLFSNKIRRRNGFNNFLFKIRVLLGAV